MKSTKFKLLSTAATPLAAAAMFAVGMAGPATAAGSGCGYGQQSAALPEAQSRDGEMILAMSHGKTAACAPNPCAAKDEAMGKAKDMTNPCAAIDKAAEEAKKAVNPCAAKPCAPCAPKSQ
jgi:hypothetical protein